MTAGSIAVPTVIPLRPPLPGRPKTAIDSNTKIELRTESAGAVIHYTINGSKPDPFQRIGDRCTMKYHGPFTLPAGKQTVKALALAKDGLRESNIVTKIFEVEYAPPPSMPVEDDDLGFQDDLDRSRARREVTRATSKLLTTPGSAWTDVDELKTTQQRLADMEVTGRTKHKPFPGTRFLETRRSDHLQASGYNTTATEQPYIFNGIGSQDLSWATERPIASRQDPPYQIQFDQSKYPRAADFLNFTTTSAGQYPGANQWMPVNVSPAGFIVPSPQGMPSVGDDSLRSRKMTQSVATQTVGLFYPSQRQIDKSKEQEEEKMAFEKQMRDRRPLLTAVSPGRGYWRKQIEHICQHLKAHTQNDAEFRALIGEPKMGKLLTTAVEEDGYEMSLTLTFALRGSKDPFLGKQLGVTRSEGYLSAHTQLDNQMYSEDEESEEEVVTSRSNGVKKVRKPKPKKKVAPKLSPLNAKLFKELGASGDVSVSDIQQLLDDGADPNCLNKNEMPPLHVAVKNRHVDAVTVLVDGGAQVNAKGPSAIKGNTALHETVNLGPTGMKVIDALLSAGADQSIKNDRGETPYDLAVKAGYENISKRFASALGQSQLEKMTKIRSY
ncbi:double zinc ribbon and ankyrin repeat-containing protein 1 [Aplysia californica]|uniref:Double zinc ribbon and ankyrin repeat-containing protein 1 n=1 Tax=Aplysia californica TaxID=6500 RepID=A0ABM1AEY8_APLCA|nr:double zinc ribbon and ankyrin repeat-containing protein 1 [Aplysia californica]XP_012946396.1 double zinc ribbon and ankyrin repeat-containing protein 1 [Aplysia californica]